MFNVIHWLCITWYPWTLYKMHYKKNAAHGPSCSIVTQEVCGTYEAIEKLASVWPHHLCI